MSVSCPHRLVIAALLTLSVAPGVARAGPVQEIAFGLGYIGFDIQGQKNPLNGGFDLLVNRNFLGNPLNFGVADLTLQGPLSLEVSTGTRGIPQFNISLTTAMNGASAPSPLNYAFTADVGGQATNVTGTLLIDSDLSVDGFGFYKLDVTISSRQDVNRSGRFANDDQEFDYDVGPISVSGNIFADILAALTDPLFAQAGLSNPFASFSGRASLAEALPSLPDSTRMRLAEGGVPVEDDLAVGLAAASLTGKLIELDAQPDSLRSSADMLPGSVSMIVPEPGVLMLLLLGLPAVMGRRLRLRRVSR